MLRLFGSIVDVFELTGRGCIVLIPDGDIAPDVKLRVGDEVVVVSKVSGALRTSVVGIELGNRFRGGFVGILLGPEVKRVDVNAGSSLMKEEHE